MQCPCGRDYGSATKVLCSCGRLLAGDGDPRRTKYGLGDIIARIIDPIGGRLYKRLHQWLFRRPCGCQKRQQWLNRWRW